MSTDNQLDDFRVDSTTSFLSGLAVPASASFSVILASGALTVSGTSSEEPTRIWQAPFVRGSDATASSPGWEEVEQAEPASSECTRKAVSELRRLSGLTWDQLGQLFEVSRRSVHFWASGKPLNAENEERLMRVLDVVRAGDRGSAQDTRAALLDSTDGTSPFDLLVAQRFEDARSLLGSGAGRVRVARTALSPEARADRAPRPPEELVDARSERVHEDLGRGRAVQTARNKRRGTS